MKYQNIKSNIQQAAEYLVSWLPKKCHYSGRWFVRRYGVWLGAVMPQVHAKYLCHPIYGKPAYILSKQFFNESERNCNTCRYLQRPSFHRNEYHLSGLMPGICQSIDFDANAHPYYQNNKFFLFPPEDFMGMKCWESREKHRRN